MKVAAQMEQWWAEHGGKHDDPEWIAYLSDFRSLLGNKLIEVSQEHTNEGRFGMSNAGGCTRAASLKLMGYEGEPRSGSTQATFWIGHMIEVAALATLGGLYRVQASGENGGQIVTKIDPFMLSYLDGVVWIDGEALNVSVKSMGYKMSSNRKGTFIRQGFAELAHEGVKSAQPKHWAQMQAEMHGNGRRKALYIAVAKDMVMAMKADPSMQENGSLTFYTEVVEYDERFAVSMEGVWMSEWAATGAGLLRRGMTYTKNGVWVTLDPTDDAANKALTGTFSPCAYCDLRNACTVAYPLAASLKESA